MATIDSIISDREVARKPTTDIPYMWLCGGVSVNQHTPSDFRSGNAEFFEKMLVDTVTATISQGFVTLDTIDQDGMRVRANAGSSSFRRQGKLAELHQQAQSHFDKLREESEDESQRQAGNARRRASQQRAAQERGERGERIRDALEQAEELHDQKEDGKSARCSTTDPDACNMHMGDGGYRPAYNFQFAIDSDARRSWR